MDKPINTDGIVLPPALLDLTEQLAENVHAQWAAGRIADGWTYGKERDDLKKTTPCLVPYSELPESEKEYDRATAHTTLKFILAMGYTIEKK